MSKLIIALAVIFTVNIGHSFEIEPFAGYGIGSRNDDTSTNFDTKALILGARAGIGIFPMFTAGVQATLLSGGSSDSTTLSQDLSGTEAGVYVKWSAPIMLQAYAGYNILANKTETLAGVDTEFTGNGFFLGVGWTGLPFVVINLEMHRDSYSESKTAGTTTTLNDTTTEMFRLTISLPLP